MQKAETQVTHVVAHTVSANQSAQRQSDTRSGDFPDMRPAAVAQRQLRVLIDNSSHVRQLQAMQQMMDANPRMKKHQGVAHMMNSRSPNSVQRLASEEIAQGVVAPLHSEEQVGPVQAKSAGAAQLQEKSEAKPNNTGLPNQLKAGIESLSGMRMDHVKVHFNSDKPAQLQAHAYAQGSEIHMGPGQEKHLPHEAWHVVQQAQGRVRPTMQMKRGVSVNDDVGLESEADMMGEQATKAAQLVQQKNVAAFDHVSFAHSANVSQLVWNKDGDTFLWDKLLDGVAWFANEEGQMHFQILDPESVLLGNLEDYRKLEGQEKSWVEWNEISIEPHPEFAPQHVEEATGDELHVDAPKGGNDKQWFPHPSEPIGWLQARSSDKVAAVVREVETIQILAELGIPVATIINRPPPAKITTADGEKPVFSPGGVWLSQVNAVTTKKPKILGHPIAGSGQIQKLTKILEKEVSNIPGLILQLQSLVLNLKVLCRYAGEVDLAFTKEGRVVVLDVAPADGGQVVEQEDGAVGTILTGVQSLIASLEKIKK